MANSRQEQIMKYVLLTLILIMLHSAGFTSSWQTGVYEAEPVEDAVVELNLTSVDAHSLAVNLTGHLGLDRFNFTADLVFTNKEKTRAEGYFVGGAITIFLTDIDDLFLILKTKNEVSRAFLKRRYPTYETPLDYPLKMAKLELPTEAQWHKHIQDALWGYWRTDSAQKFDSFRCNNGDTPDVNKLCQELREAYIFSNIDKSYTNTLSRQVYTYGVIYNLTGNLEALALMNKGLALLLQRFDENGDVATVEKDGLPVYPMPRQTSQDIAYAQLGLAMAFYLTGDPALLRQLNLTRERIMSSYYNEDMGMLAWTLEDQFPGDSDNRELVAQLDQLNGYLLLVYPLLPESLKGAWSQDISLLVDVLLRKFHDTKRNRFSGILHKGEFNEPGQRHNDFGHSVKTYWMIYIAGQYLNNPRYIEVGKQGIAAINQQAIRFRTTERAESLWANNPNTDYSAWWEFAELTQATATLAMEETSQVVYLPDIYRGWFNLYVDKIQGGVWPYPGSGSKQNQWKNGFHESEMALVGYITSQVIKDEPVALYFQRESGHFQPYYFSTLNAQSISESELGFKVIFDQERHNEATPAPVKLNEIVELNITNVARVIEEDPHQ